MAGNMNTVQGPVPRLNQPPPDSDPIHPLHYLWLAPMALGLAMTAAVVLAVARIVVRIWSQSMHDPMDLCAAIGISCFALGAVLAAVLVPVVGRGNGRHQAGQGNRDHDQQPT